MSTSADVDWERRPGEYIHQTLARSVFASVATCLEESGEPLTPAQLALLDAAVASSGVDPSG